MIEGIIFDYGGTLDSRGAHWSEVLWEGYRQARVPIDKATFRTAYVEGERALAREGIDSATRDQWVEQIAAYCDNAARSCIDEARPMLERLQERYPMMLVSNFYGNIDEVLRDYGIRHLFKGIIESAVVGVRKPNPTLFRLGVDALELPAEQVLVVGDSLRKDIEPSEQLGCHVLWLKGKGWTEEEDQQTHPHTIKRVTEVEDWIKKL